MKTGFTGSGVAIVTPFTKMAWILKAWKIIDYQIENKPIIPVCGTTYEYHHGA